MKATGIWVGASLVVVMSVWSAARASSLDIAALNQRVLDACPAYWEDVRTAIDPESVVDDHWQADAADRDAFIDFIETELGLSAPDPADLAAMADDIATVAAECATQRLGLLDGLIDQIPTDALAAIDAVSSQLEGIQGSLGNDGFLVGDIRMTGRSEPADGWLFLAGQTIGAVGSGAELEGDEYEALFELAKTWLPNSGTEDFAAAGVVTLPDLRGRVIAGVDAVGDAVAGVLDDPAARQAGGVLGAQSHALTVGQMPSHSHGMNSTGSHSHSYTDVSTHSGSSIQYGSGRGDSNQSRTTGSAGNHKHTIYATGGNQPHPIVQPTIVFNIEMKYR